MTIKTRYDIGQKVFALSEEHEQKGFYLKSFTVEAIVAEEIKGTENDYMVRARLQPESGVGTELLCDKDIFQNEEDFLESMKELWKNRK